jgi:hypothetical protein
VRKVEDGEALSPGPPAKPAGRLVLLILPLADGTAVRAWWLDARPFWVDEAETGVNALTILRHCPPVDRYLGEAGRPLHELVGRHRRFLHARDET